MLVVVGVICGALLRSLYLSSLTNWKYSAVRFGGRPTDLQNGRILTEAWRLVDTDRKLPTLSSTFRNLGAGAIMSLPSGLPSFCGLRRGVRKESG
jgi:hypothetical protein